MNFLSSIFSRGPSTEKSIVTLSPGEFSLVRREDSPQGRRELIFPEAEISLLSTTREFFVQIHISDLSREDHGSEDDEEFTEFNETNERTFLVHPEIKLGYYLVGDRVAIAWRDVDGDDGDRFEFLCAESVPREALDIFDHKALEAQYGQKYGRKPPTDMPESGFDEFTYNYNVKSTEKSRTTSRRGSSFSAVAAASGDLNSTPASSGVDATQSSVRTNAGKAEEGQKDGRNEDKDPESTESVPLSPGRITASETCDLCIYDSVQNIFVSPKNLRGVTAVVLDQANYDYFLEVRSGKTAVLGTAVHEELNQYIDIKNHALIFNFVEETGLVMSYLLRFESQDSLTKFETALSIAQWEGQNRRRWQDVKETDQQYLIDVMTGLNVEESDNGDSDHLGSDDEEDSMDVDVEAEDPTSKASHEKNSALEVGHINDRTYVVRGNRIGVFKNTDSDLEYSTTIDNLAWDPSRILLHEQDRALVLQAADKKDTLYRMDLETGKIVDEWETGKNVNDFNPVSKFAAITAEQTLLGVADKALFRIDPREGGKMRASAGRKVYKSDIGLSTVATTSSGFMVVGNKNGELRLYEKLGSDAKTLMPGLGDPIIGIDVTADGKYVLATCERYLLLVETATNGANGFTDTWLRSQRPRPRKLQISPENTAFMQQATNAPVKFTPARFNTGMDAKEATIVTSTGPYLVTWSLRSVLRGIPNAYRIKVYNSQITAENFKFGTDRRVILTLEDDVNMVAKSALKAPKDVLRRKRQDHET